MADKDLKDTHKVTTPKAKEEFSVPNDLKEALKDLDSYEKLNKNLKLNSPKGDRMETEKHTPEKELPKVLKDTTDDKKLPLENVRENEGANLDKEVEKQLDDARKEAPFSAVTNKVEASLDKEADFGYCENQTKGFECSH